MKKLLSILASVGMVGMTSATVVSCKNPSSGNESQNFKDKLDQKVKEVQTSKEKIEKEHSNKWVAPAKARQERLQSAIQEAETALAEEGLTEDVANEHVGKLEEEIAKFESSLPKNIISKVINEQEDIKDSFSKDWSYATFFNKDGGDKKESQQRILDLFYAPINKLAVYYDYTADELKEFNEFLLKWSQENVKLVYINVDNNGVQKIAHEYVVTEEDRTLEDLFLEKVKVEFGEEVEQDPDFWTKHPKLSLGIKFPKNVLGSELNEDTKEFWTFTFAENTPFKENEEKIKNIFQEAASKQGGIVFEIKKGLKKETSFKEALNMQVKQLFYGKLFIPKDIVLKYNRAPKQEQIDEGKGTWTTPEGARIRFLQADGETELFRIETSYSIKWIS